MNAKNWIIEFWHFRELLVALTLREIKIRYKQTLLGAAWAVLQPAALAVIFSIIFGHFLQIESPQTPYIVFYYSALVPWTFFSNSVTFGSLSVVNNSSLVTNVYFPREILPFASIGAAFFDFITSSLIFLMLMIFYKVNPSINVLYLFLIIPSIFIFAAGISLILSTINVMYRDIKFVVPLVLQVWLFATPIIYTIDRIPDSIRKFYVFNPLAPLINSFRQVTVLDKNPSIFELQLAILISIMTFLFGILFFKYKERVFADII